jgi:hypothetical protein
MRPLSAKVLQVLLQRLLLEKDLVAVLTLVLSCLIMPIQVHTQSAGLGRREITLGTRVQPRLIFRILALAWHV